MNTQQAIGVFLKPGTHYPHVTWAHGMLRVQLGYVTLNSGAHSHFCHSAYVTWSDVELWSAHMPACLLNFCWHTYFVRSDVCHVSRNIHTNATHAVPSTTETPEHHFAAVANIITPVDGRIRPKHVESYSTCNKAIHLCIKLDTHLPYQSVYMVPLLYPLYMKVLAN
jgi:hypothetical protein